MLITARTVALGIVLSCGAAAAVAFAQAPPAPASHAAPATASAGDRRAPRTPPDDIPSLTALQREQVAALRHQTRLQLAPQREQLRAQRAELRTLWFAEPPSEQAILKKLAEIDAIRAAMRPTLVKSRLEQLTLLTRDQRLALWTRPPHECPRCARHTRRMPDHAIAAPRSKEMMPWLDDGDDYGPDGDGTFEIDPMRCPPDEPSPPPGAKPDAR